VAAIKRINELNIGHALVAHALFVGFKSAVSGNESVDRGRRQALRA